MRAENKQCQNCKQQFMVESDDFDFYKKMKVPPPTWCPMCRTRRRMSWRNEWQLFRKKEEVDGKEIFSVYHPDANVKIYTVDYWNSDAWDPMQYGKEYDWGKPFITQVAELLRTVPLPARAGIDLVNSEYCMNAGWLKNCYMVFNASYVEDSAYLISATRSKDSFDCDMVEKCELCYGNINCRRCYKTLFSVDCEDCQEVTFSKDCIGCSSCFGCANLRNKQFHVFNTPYSKEEYAKKIMKFSLDSFRVTEELREKIFSFWLQFPNRFMKGRHNTNVTGEYIYNSKNAKHCYRVKECENVKYCQILTVGPTNDCYDYTIVGGNVELMYETAVSIDGAHNLKFCWYSFSDVRNLEYCIYCKNSSDLFGCVGLRNKQYCI
ncbi:hypothetical protein MYX07_03580, partial [Patescibacteria group bacterium AH-259-L07]|nr:hypothetical protein [Patescibacteria group bacterium AH-259-L07]